MSTITVKCLSQDFNGLIPYLKSGKNLIKVLHANMQKGNKSSISLLPNQQTIIPTGIKLSIPQGYRLHIRSNNELVRTKLVVSSLDESVHSDNQDEIAVCLTNYGTASVRIHDGDEIAECFLEKIQGVKLATVAS